MLPKILKFDFDGIKIKFDFDGIALLNAIQKSKSKGGGRALKCEL